MQHLMQNELERNLREKLQNEVRNEITRRNLGPGELAKLLGLFPSTTLRLLHQVAWPLDVSMRIASCLKIDVKFTIEK